MEHINITEKNIDLHELVKRIGCEGRIRIISRGRTVAQLLPVTHSQKKLPPLASFREKISISKISPLKVLEALRKEAR